MGHRSIQQKNGPLTTEIAILNLERMAHSNFMFIGNKWKMYIKPGLEMPKIQNDKNKSVQSVPPPQKKGKWPILWFAKL